MNPDVPLEIRLLEVCLWTLRTLEGPFADVKPVVTSQVRLLLERLRTVVALVGAKSAVNFCLNGGKEKTQFTKALLTFIL